MQRIQSLSLAPASQNTKFRRIATCSDRREGVRAIYPTNVRSFSMGLVHATSFDKNMCRFIQASASSQSPSQSHSTSVVMRDESMSGRPHLIKVVNNASRGETAR
ncbi:hypothetical protein FRC18_008008 [Serendipita sp. 400]|nr:hypothetical protein FRC18_008008 [Serendipita sp. 400]